MEAKKLTTEQFNAVYKVFQFLIRAEYHCTRLLEYYGDKEQHMYDLVFCRQEIDKAYDELKAVLDAGKEEYNGTESACNRQ